jgi:ferredoxin-thioredoxin reductase catalytic subunit
MFLRSFSTRMDHLGPSVCPCHHYEAEFKAEWASFAGSRIKERQEVSEKDASG